MEYVLGEYKFVRLDPPLPLRERVAVITVAVEIAAFLIIGIWFLARLA